MWPEPADKEASSAKEASFQTRRTVDVVRDREGMECEGKEIREEEGGGQREETNTHR
jgi:hypothetical protein